MLGHSQNHGDSRLPIEQNTTMPATFIDPLQPSTAAPNRVRDFTPVTNGANGTLKIRHRFTNNTGLPIIALRYRIIAITTLTGAPLPPGPSNLYGLTSTSVDVFP